MIDIEELTESVSSHLRSTSSELRVFVRTNSDEDMIPNSHVLIKEYRSDIERPYPLVLVEPNYRAVKIDGRPVDVKEVRDSICERIWSDIGKGLSCLSNYKIHVSSKDIFTSVYSDVLDHYHPHVWRIGRSKELCHLAMDDESWLDLEVEPVAVIVLNLSEIRCIEIRDPNSMYTDIFDPTFFEFTTRLGIYLHPSAIFVQKELQPIP